MKTVFVAAVLTLLSTPLLAGDAMTAKELHGLLSAGKTIKLGGDGKGYSGTLNLTSDGKGVGQLKLQDGTVIKIDGVWHLKGNKFCRKWNGGRDAGKQVCETWIKTGPKAVDVKVGKAAKGNNYWD